MTVVCVGVVQVIADIDSLSKVPVDCFHGANRVLIGQISDDNSIWL